MSKKDTCFNCFVIPAYLKFSSAKALAGPLTDDVLYLELRLLLLFHIYGSNSIY